jgi:hypothetical protein
MALQIKDRVKETTTTTGTGDLTLSGAATGFQAFSAACSDGDTTWYALQAVDGNGTPTGDWEVGVGTYHASGNTLSRTTVLASSNSGSAVNLAAGTKQVWLDLPASRVRDPIGAYLANRPVASAFTVTQSTNLSGGVASVANLASGRGFTFTVQPPSTSAAEYNAFALQSCPAGSSWSVIALVNWNAGIRSSYSKFGLCVADASNNSVSWGWGFAASGDPALGAYMTFSATLNGAPGYNSGFSGMPAMGTPVWMKLTYTAGGNFVFYTSVDGETWVQRHTVSVTAVIGTPTKCGFYLNVNDQSGTSSAANMACVATVLHYQQG